MLAQVGEELRGGQRRERMAIEIAAQIRVELVASDRRFDRLQQRRAFFVGDRSDRIVRIAALEIDVEDRLGRRRADARDLVDQLAAAEHFQHRRALAPVERFHDAELEVDGEAFVQPEVAPRRVGHQVARPRMRELVRDERRQRSIAGEDRRRREREARILHAAERERRRQHENVVASPAIRPADRLGGLHHLLEVGEFVRGRARAPRARCRRRCAGRAIGSRDRRPRAR